MMSSRNELEQTSLRIPISPSRLVHGPHKKGVFGRNLRVVRDDSLNSETLNGEISICGTQLSR